MSYTDYSAYCAGLLLGLGLFSGYCARFAAPVVVVLVTARGSARAPSLTPLFAFASAVFACSWYHFNQCEPAWPWCLSICNFKGVSCLTIL